MGFGFIPGIICYNTGGGGITSQYIRQITIDHTQVGGQGFTDYKIFVRLQDVTLNNIDNGGHVAKINGNDIKFYDSDFNLLTWEIEFYDGNDPFASDLLCAWVKLPTVSSQTDTIFYIGYGDTTVQSFVGGNPWTQEYIGVYHLGNGNDSTTNNLVLTGYNTNTVTFTAPTRFATLFDGTTPVYYKYEGQSSLFDITGGITLSCWLNIPTDADTSANVIMGRWTDQEYGYGLLLINNDLYMAVKDANTPGTNGIFWCIFNDITQYWYQWLNVVGTFIPNQGVYLYINGQLVASNETNPISTQNISQVPFYIGTGDNSGTPTYAFNGLLGECKILDTALTSEQIATEYINQSNPGNIGSAGFMTIGDEQIIPGYVFYIDSNSYSGQGSTWFDLSPNGHDVTLINQPTYDQQDANGSLVFDSLQYGIMTYTPDFNFSDGTDFTYETWVKFTDLSDISIPFSKGKHGANFDWGLQVANGNELKFYSNATQSSVSGTATISTNTWYHLVVTGKHHSGSYYDLDIYVNGDKIVSEQPINMTNSQTQNIQIAGYGYTSDYNPPLQTYQGNPYAYGKLIGKLGVCRVYRKYFTTGSVNVNYTFDKTRFGY